MNPIRIILLAALSLVFSPSAGAAQAGAETVLNPGDAVRITVWRRDDLSGEFSIAADGTVVHPLLKQVVVTGISLPEAERRLGEMLQRVEGNAPFVVEGLLRVSVGGEVRTPNLYALTPVTTVSQAVALAGGISDRGRLDRVRLIRGGTEQMIDLTDPAQRLSNMTVRSGDQIVVARRGNVFRDVIAPAGSLAAAVVSLIGILTRE
ncbi:MAG: SLBB domain-containing protein [Gemmatimonadetes bacterium]|nr:SLBB domain-containing protein [Gemmatimonadota bacterium]